MNTQITNLVEQTVLDRMRAREAFTALDISNALKGERYPVRHGDVAASVRDIYQSGAMAPYDYDRRLIDVVTEGGAQKARAFLYLHDGTREREYDRRDQSALPPVPAEQARDLTDSVAAGALPLLPRGRAGASGPRPARGRRDGALAIPRDLVRRLGWAVGQTLAVGCDGDGLTLTVRPAVPGQPAEVRVWGGQRVRVCKTTLRLGALSAERVTVEVEGQALTISGARRGPSAPV